MPTILSLLCYVLLLHVSSIIESFHRGHQSLDPVNSQMEGTGNEARSPKMSFAP